MYVSFNFLTLSTDYLKDGDTYLDIGDVQPKLPLTIVPGPVAKLLDADGHVVHVKDVVYASVVAESVDSTMFYKTLQKTFNRNFDTEWE